MVLKVLWDAGPLTARAVYDSLPRSHPLAITTVHTVLNRMVKKGLVRREGRAYRASVDQVTTAGNLLGKLLGKLFGGSPAKLMQNLLTGRDVNAAELDELDQLIRNRREKQRRQR